MRIFDDSFSKYSLQRWVAYIGGAGAFIVAALNFSSIVEATELPLWQALANNGVSSILVFAILFFLTSTADSNILRTIQVVIFLLGGVATAVGSVPGNITSALFAIYGIILVNEYAGEKSRLVPSLLIGVAYMIVFVLTAQPDTVQPTFYLVSATVFTGQIVLLFALVTHRQTMIRQRYSQRLESTVRERTAELRVAVTERDQIIRELHHRVGNSLQLLASYVSLQRGELTAEGADVLQLTELRIHGIASVHAALHSQEQLTHVPLRDFALERITETGYSFETVATVSSRVETTARAHIDFLLSFAVVLTELIANAARHGRRDGETRGTVTVSVLETAGQIVTTVEDDGPGFPADFEPGLGSVFVDQLVGQLEGTVERANKPGGGARVRVAIPIESVERSPEPVKQPV